MIKARRTYMLIPRQRKRFKKKQDLKLIKHCMLVIITIIIDIIKSNNINNNLHIAVL